MVLLLSALQAGTVRATEVSRPSPSPSPCRAAGSAGAEPPALTRDGSEAGDLSRWASVLPDGVLDPELDGPYAWSTFTARVRVAATGHAFDVKGWIPSGGPAPGPYPLVVVAHGFRLAASQYDGYARRLASFGYVALNADSPTPLFSANHRESAQDLLGVVTWAATAAEVAGRAEVARTAMVGHSLGGKVALLAATLDRRVVAVVGLDPVDSAPPGCAPADCPDVSERVGSLAIPTLLLGETADATGRLSCAPAADNYATFFARTPAPSLEVTVLGANHVSFLDDVAGCGLKCRFCQKSTVSDETVNALAKAYVVAFLEYHVRGIAGYATYLTGERARTRYLTTGRATLRWR